MWTVDDQWKRDVLEVMKKKGITRADLARLIGVGAPSLTLLFKAETRQTRLKPAIHKALGLIPPAPTPAVERDDAVTRLLRIWKELSDEQREHLLKTGELLARKLG